MTIPKDRLDAIEQSPHALIATTDEVRELVRAYRAAPDHSVDANKVVANGFDVESMLRATLPGGSVCDPQQVADAIRGWFAKAQPTTDNGQGLHLSESLWQVMYRMLADAYERGTDDRPMDMLKMRVRFDEALATHPPQQEQAAVSDGFGVDMLPLPKCYSGSAVEILWGDGERSQVELYSADQMVRYAREAIRIVAAPAAPATPESAEPVAWPQPIATAPRDGTTIKLWWGRSGIDGVSQGRYRAENPDFPWEFVDGPEQDGDWIINRAVDTEYGPTHWSPFHPTPAASDGGLREALDYLVRSSLLLSDKLPSAGSRIFDTYYAKTELIDFRNALADVRVRLGRATPPTEQAKPSEAPPPAAAGVVVDEAMVRDASRYRFLRGDGGPNSIRWPRWQIQYWSGFWNPVQGKEMDAAVDSAIGLCGAGQQKEGGR